MDSIHAAWPRASKRVLGLSTGLSDRAYTMGDTLDGLGWVSCLSALTFSFYNWQQFQLILLLLLLSAMSMSLTNCP